MAQQVTVLGKQSISLDSLVEDGVMDLVESGVNSRLEITDLLGGILEDGPLFMVRLLQISELLAPVHLLTYLV